MSYEHEDENRAILKMAVIFTDFPTGRGSVNIMSIPEITGVIFSVACAKNSVHRGGDLPQCMLAYHSPPPWEQTPPPQEQTSPLGSGTSRKQAPPSSNRYPPRSRLPPRTRHICPPLRRHPLPSAYWEIRSTSGRYAFYWNAFLSNVVWLSLI